MNKEEILAMEAGKLLDIEVAESVMGWTKYLTPEGDLCHWERGNVIEALANWSPSTDISAAWLVVEKMRNDWNITIITGNLKIGRVVMHPLRSLEPLIEVNTTDVPEAICKAALLAKLEKK